MFPCGAVGVSINMALRSGAVDVILTHWAVHIIEWVGIQMFSMHGTLSAWLFEALAAEGDIWWLMGSDVKAVPTVPWDAAALPQHKMQETEGRVSVEKNQYLLISEEVKHGLSCRHFPIFSLLINEKTTQLSKTAYNVSSFALFKLITF